MLKNSDNGVAVNLPMDQRPGILMPTPANLERMAREAEEKRQREAQARNSNPVDLGRTWGVSRELVLYLQRLEAKIADLEKQVAQLEADRTSALPRHLRGVETR